MHNQLSILKNNDQKLILDKQGSFINYFPNYLKINEADNLYRILLSEIEWDDSKRSIYGKINKFSRKSSFYAMSGLQYKFSGRKFPGREMSPTMLKVLNDLKINCDYHFNSILFNYYHDGKDMISWHRDNEKELGDDPIIGTISLGQERPFLLRNCLDHSIKHEFQAIHGSLLVMEGTTQNYWEHSVPQRMRLREPRLSLTLRNIKN